MKYIPVIGVVLAGGKSSRLGQDKAALCVAASGKSLLEHTVALLQQLFATVLVSGRIVSYAHSFTDTLLHHGPMGGIYTAMRHAEDTAYCILSCDMPCMQTTILMRLLAARNERPADSVVTWYVSPANRANPLVAIYEPEALPILASNLGQGQFSLTRAIPLHRQHRITYFEKDAPAFFNMNTFHDYEAMINQGVLRQR